MRQTKRGWQVRAAWLILAAIVAAQSGCLAVAAGCAAGGAAGYAYYKGRLERDYAANRDDVWAALHTSLGELQMPITKESRDPDEDHIESRTADVDKVKIDIEIHKSRIPAEGEVSKVCIRVATFGDTPVSSRVLDQVDRHLIPGTPAATTVLGQPQPVNGAPPPAQPVGAPAQSPPPPLAQGGKSNP